MEEPGAGLAGGMNVFLRGLLPRLAARGISTDVLTRGTGAAPEVTRPFPGVRILHVPCGWNDPPTRESAHGSLSRFVRGAAGLLASAGESHDVVSAHYWMSGVAARELGRPAPPFVFMYHTVEVLKIPPSGTRAGTLPGIRGREENRIAAEAGAVVFFSREDFERTSAALPALKGKGRIVPPGVDDAFRRPPPREGARRALELRPDEFLFLLAARADPGKNTAAAVAAFRTLRAGRGPRVRLLVAGQDLPPERLPDGASCAGPVAHGGMPGLLSAADAVLCPSLYESFGLVPLEAMAAGVPVILPDSVYWGKKVRSEGGGLAYAADAGTGLLEAMRIISGDRRLRDRLGEEGIRVAGPFTWERCAASWAGILSRSARSRSPR